MALPQQNKVGQLRRNAISVIGAVALAMAFMGPATSVFFNTNPAASGAGYALPFALLLALIVSALVASAIGAFAQKIPTAGFAYTFNTHGFGKRGGFLSGWILVFSYAMVGPMLLSAIGLQGWRYGAALLSHPDADDTLLYCVHFRTIR